jgi:dephospho-CoA kinase
VRVIGLTGGIASGKSTVARLFRERGVAVIDADELAREVVELGQPALAELVEAFGRSILNERGRLDRKRLAARVFTRPGERRTLNEIVHPRIAAAAAERLAQLAREGARFALYEAALLVENGLHNALDGLIVVSLPADLQHRRMCLRDGFSDEEARSRLASQGSLADKAAVATWIIDNSGSLDNTKRQVEEVLRQIENGSRDHHRREQ